MPFKLGNQHGKRPKPGAGRPTKEKQKIKRLAAEMTRKYIEDRLKPIMDVYLGLAGGTVVKVGKRKFKLEVDPATTRDVIAKFVPDAVRSVHIDMTPVEEFYSQMQDRLKK